MVNIKGCGYLLVGKEGGVIENRHGGFRGVHFLTIYQAYQVTIPHNYFMYFSTVVHSLKKNSQKRVT